MLAIAPDPMRILKRGRITTPGERLARRALPWLDRGLFYGKQQTLSRIFQKSRKHLRAEEVGGMLEQISKQAGRLTNFMEDTEMRKMTLIPSLILISMFLAGCGGTGEISYSPPGIPAKVSIDTNGNINVGLSPAWCTPIGIFELGYDKSVYSLRDSYTSRVLIVRVDNTATVYELVEGQNFKISFDDDNKLYKRVALQYETDGDIVLELESVPQSSPNETGNNSSAPANNTTDSEAVSCPGAKYPTRIRPGRDASVCTKIDRVIIRTSAGMNESEILSLYTGTTVRVLEGPVCADNFWWWKVEIYPGTTYGLQAYGYDPLGTTDQTNYGWVREGWDEKDAYFICQ